MPVDEFNYNRILTDFFQPVEKSNTFLTAVSFNRLHCQLGTGKIDFETRVSRFLVQSRYFNFMFLKLILF